MRPHYKVGAVVRAMFGVDAPVVILGITRKGEGYKVKAGWLSSGKGRYTTSGTIGHNFNQHCDLYDEPLTDDEQIMYAKLMLTEAS